MGLPAGDCLLQLDRRAAMDAGDAPMHRLALELILHPRDRLSVPMLADNFQRVIDQPALTLLVGAKTKLQGCVSNIGGNDARGCGHDDSFASESSSCSTKSLACNSFDNVAVGPTRCGGFRLARCCAAVV